MKRKDLDQLKEKNIDALRKIVSEADQKIAVLRAEILTGRQKNFRLGKNERVRRAIANTLLREKEIIERTKATSNK